MNTQKLMIIVLVVIVVIFVITLGMGGCQGSDKPNPKDAPGSVRSLKGLQGKRFLTIGDKATTNCAVPGPTTLRVNGSCSIVFEKRAFFRTSTRVVFAPSTFVRVVVIPKDGPSQDDTVSPGRCVAYSVGHGGGTMTLSGNNVTLFLQRKSCPE
jgi:hypothetical protein